MLGISTRRCPSAPTWAPLAIRWDISDELEQVPRKPRNPDQWILDTRVLDLLDNDMVCEQKGGSIKNQVLTVLNIPAMHQTLEFVKTVGLVIVDEIGEQYKVF